MATPKVHTYHCTFCSHLLLASTHVFASLPQRRTPGLDHATIVPMPPPPQYSDEDEDESDTEQKKNRRKGYTLQIMLQRDRAARIVAREDGFEKRVLWRCGRCRVVVAYQLDECHYVRGGKDTADPGERFLYVLPAAVTESQLLGKEVEV